MDNVHSILFGTDTNHKSLYISFFVLLISLLLIMAFDIPGLTSRWNVKGKHIFITGGSQGLGLALAELVASKGADVTICARGKDKLEQAVEQIRLNTKGSSTKIAFISADVSTFEGAQKALAIASGKEQDGTSSSQVGRIPDAVFGCAGASKPGYFLEQTEKDFESGIKTIYMTALSTAHATTKLFIENQKQGGKLVLTGSTLSLMGMVGYAQYAPMKFAIRGLAECLRQEYLLYEKSLRLSVHAYFPGTILTPGYEEENKTKPKITYQLEGEEKNGLTAKVCANALLAGVERNQFFITSDFETELIRASTASRGPVPGNHFVLDRIKSFIGLIGLLFWRNFEADSSIRKFANQHPQEVPGLKSS